jgi:hypothetical protein
MLKIETRADVMDKAVGILEILATSWLIILIQNISAIVVVFLAINVCIFVVQEDIEIFIVV